MSTEDVEAIRQRMISLLVDAENLKRKVDRIVRSKGQTQHQALIALTFITDRIDRETRELYHLLPEHLRPTALPPLQMPRESRPEGLERREHPGPRPGGKIPRKVRWPDWTIEDILALADAFYEKHGKWPSSNSGRISDASPDTWTGIDLALTRGNRGLPGGTTLARLLIECRGAYDRSKVPQLDTEKILSWADDHYARTQSWPTSYSGPVTGTLDETWVRIDHALRRGMRGIMIKTSLSRLLAERRGVPHLLHQDDLTVEQILTWADAHHSRTGKWPTSTAGDIPEAPHENWGRLDHCLIQGNRSLRGGSSIAKLLAEHRGVRNRKALPPLDIEQLLVWADLHYERHGRWPTVWSGKIEDVPDESWTAVDASFKAGGRGLAGCGYRSLAHLLDERRGKLRRRGNRPAERDLPDSP
ncbi:MAG: hypothetical protein JWL77_2378 [Chthonomonadaceae bacterium]|nr:hypothetical protein [Chthonomonadaceae bacterium]